MVAEELEAQSGSIKLPRHVVTGRPRCTFAVGCSLMWSGQQREQPAGKRGAAARALS
jgi:hypothetical protein